LRIVTPELVTHPIGQASALLLQVFEHARPLAQLDQQRLLKREKPKGPGISPQRVTEHMGVPTVVLGAGDREAIAEAVKLLRIDRMDLEPSFHEGLDHRPTRGLDRNADLTRLGSGLLKKPIARLR
jgi:hypothetical protein